MAEGSQLSSGARGAREGVAARLLVAFAIVAAVLLAYRPAFDAPLIFDDHQALTENPSIRHLDTAWSPPRDGRGVTGRPLLNFSFALNYAFSGLQPRGYRLTNVAIHALGALTLFGLVRRTFLLPALRDRFGPAAGSLAAGAALWWALHPLQTESVTCIAQRSESLVGLFYLLTFHCFVRGWRSAAVAMCLLGMATKEVMATAPVLILLYDRALVAGTWQAAWQRGRIFYLTLAATWLPLGWLVLGQNGSRGNTGGAAVLATVWHYLLTQCGALTRYFTLAVWPYPLVLDYDTRLVTRAADALPGALVVLVLLGATLVAWRRAPWLGFAGAWCWLILAPSSSFVPLVPQPIAEHRMYLPLAALTTTGAAGLHLLLRRRAGPILLLLAAANGCAAAARNQTYRSEEAIWRDTVTHAPTNARAHFYLALALENSGQRPAAIARYEQALALHPAYAEALSNLGRLLGQLGRADEAVQRLEAALAVQPELLVARVNLGLYLPLVGRTDEAIACLTPIVAAAPGNAAAHAALADAWLRKQRPAQAIPHYAAAARAAPAASETESNWGAACLMLGRASEALQHIERALELAPENLAARRNRGLALLALGRRSEAEAQFAMVLRAAPGDPVAVEQLARLRAETPSQP